MASIKKGTAIGKAPATAVGVAAERKAKQAAIIDAQYQIAKYLGSSNVPSLQIYAGTESWDAVEGVYTFDFEFPEKPENNSNPKDNQKPETPASPEQSAQEEVKNRININLPNKIIDFTESTLQNSTFEKMTAALKNAYDKIVEQIEAKVNEFNKTANSAEKNQAAVDKDAAMQALGLLYNKQYDEIIAYYQKHNLLPNQKQNTTPNQKQGTTPNQQQNQNRINVVNRLMELRNTPGYQNYAVGTEKTIDGIVGSSVYKKYYSDISAELYFNGHWFEDISAVQWQVQRQTYPLFGYNSFIYDDVALGNRIIYGAFSINFTEPNRLNDVIAKSKVNERADTDVASYEKVSQTVSRTTINVQGQQTKIETNPAHATIWSPRFDIDIVFGESDILKSAVILPKHIILWDCHLMGSQISMATNDGVLQESYQFLARDFKVIK